jgi:predicted nucleic acid-binding Zn ribbon protein
MSPRDDEVRRRQRGRAIVMALALAAFVVLMYLITIARMSGG